MIPVKEFSGVWIRESGIEAVRRYSSLPFHPLSKKYKVVGTENFRGGLLNSTNQGQWERVSVSFPLCFDAYTGCCVIFNVKVLFYRGKQGKAKEKKWKISYWFQISCSRINRGKGKTRKNLYRGLGLRLKKNPGPTFIYQRWVTKVA